MDRTILHCDCNSYFASVECIGRPELRSVPMAVCGDPESRHGIILAKNELAKRYGIKTAETIWQAKKKCPGLTLVTPHHHLYEEYSERINRIYEEYTDLVEPFSIDESWLDVTGTTYRFGTGREIANELRRRVREEIGITISVGVSYNKVFAKLGSDYKKPDATTVITRENYQSILWPLPAADMLFVGSVTAERLAGMGIDTIGAIARAGREQMRAILGRGGETVWEYAMGLDASPVKSREDIEQPKSIGNSITFPHDLQGRQEICAGLLTLSDKVGSRLRRHGLYCATVQIQIKDPHLRTISRQQKLKSPTNVTKEIYDAAVAIAEKSWPMSAPVRLLSVTGAGLTDRCAEQMALIDDTTDDKVKSAKLDQAMDTIRSRFGKDAISFGRLIKKPEDP
ncbi:MAG: DNA polymerase IV [Clostridiales bacterium]|nr:DNA polymerase IV [Clostridiales bacterium]